VRRKTQLWLPFRSWTAIMTMTSSIYYLDGAAGVLFNHPIGQSSPPSCSS
jgi:hypothetical protein